MSLLNQLFCFSISLFGQFLFAGSELTVKGIDDQKTFTTEQLLNHKDTKIIKFENVYAYGNKDRKFKAIKLAKLFENIKVPPNSMIKFETTDGFSSYIPQSRLLNKENDASIAYIAIEDPKSKWANVIGRDYNPGPFYLVWLNPNKSNIRQEEWPYMLSGFSIAKSLKELYPEIFPSKKLSSNHEINKGFTVFVQHCFACHTMNKQGASNFGPDLNIPMSPIEYYKPGIIKKLIRNPQNLRYWPKSMMYGFSKDKITDEELDNLISYFSHMASGR